MGVTLAPKLDSHLESAYTPERGGKRGKKEGERKEKGKKGKPRKKGKRKKKIMSSMSSASRRTIPLFCHCGKRLKITTLWTENNPGRRFYNCEKYSVKSLLIKKNPSIFCLCNSRNML